MAARYTSRFEPKRGDRDDVGTVKRDQPMNGTHKFDGCAIRPLIAHHFGDRKLGNGIVEGGLQTLHKARTGDCYFDDRVLHITF